MKKINLENEKLKKLFFEYQKNAKGLSDATIQSNKNCDYCCYRVIKETKIRINANSV